MKIIILIWLASYILLMSFFSTAQDIKNTNQLKHKLESTNRQLTSAVLSQDINKLMMLYTSDAVCMPEYQPMLKGAGAIREYFQEIFNRQQVKVYDKKIMEVIDMREDVAEIGSFIMEFSPGKEQSLMLTGKYLNIWRVQPEGALQLKAESFGYFHTIENPINLTVKIQKHSAESGQPQSLSDNKNISFELNAMNVLMEKAVRNRDGNLRADFFSQDAIFMPFADSMKVGMKEIRQHLIEYNRGNVIIDSIRIYSDYIEILDSYVIEYPKFYVRWHTPDLAGSGQGKGIRIWRRESDCSLKLYREIGLHDNLE